MKQFLKDNWFKIVITVAILIVAVALGYYFAIYLPKEKAEKEYLNNQIKCQQEGVKLYEKEKLEGEKYADSISSLERILGYFIYGEEFKFNKKLNTCLYKGERYYGITVNFRRYFIKDVYTNREILVWESSRTLDGDWENGTSNEAEWNKKYNELFEITSSLKKN